MLGGYRACGSTAANGFSKRTNARMKVAAPNRENLPLNVSAKILKTF
jgi:hypothetical protein